MVGLQRSQRVKQNRGLKQVVLLPPFLPNPPV
jgi:hypothetical protein